VIVAGLCLIGAGLLAAAWCARFSYVSVCPICGEIQSTTEWQIPFSSVTYYRWSNLKATPLSRAIAGRLPPGTHSHRWEFCSGGGNGVMCAIGKGQFLWSAMQRPYFVKIVGGVLSYGTPQEVKAMRSRLDNSEQLLLIDMAGDESGFPKGGCKNRQEYQRWWKEHHEQWERFWKQSGA
jgi:hypothetical protein